MSDDVLICKGCLKPIEADEQGRRSYRMMMDLNGGPADRIHASDDCKLRYQVRLRQARVEADQLAIEKLSAQLQ